VGTLPNASMMLQDGDQVFMLVTDDMMDRVREVGAAAPAAERV
jgi:trk system potassium uptake protein TrkA